MNVNAPGWETAGLLHDSMATGNGSRPPVLDEELEYVLRSGGNPYGGTGKAVERPPGPVSRTGGDLYAAPGGPRRPQQPLLASKAPASSGLSHNDVQVERAKSPGLPSWQVSGAPPNTAHTYASLPLQQPSHYMGGLGREVPPPSGPGTVGNGGQWHQQQQQQASQHMQGSQQAGMQQHYGVYQSGATHAHLRAQQQQQLHEQQQQRRIAEIRRQQLLAQQVQQLQQQQQQQQQQQVFAQQTARGQMHQSVPSGGEHHHHNAAALRAAHSILQSQGMGWPNNQPQQQPQLSAQQIQQLQQLQQQLQQQVTPQHIQQLQHQKQAELLMHLLRVQQQNGAAGLQQQQQQQLPNAQLLRQLSAARNLQALVRADQQAAALAPGGHLSHGSNQQSATQVNTGNLQHVSHGQIPGGIDMPGNVMELLERLSLLRSRQQNPQGLTNEQVQQLQHAITETARSIDKAVNPSGQQKTRPAWLEQAVFGTQARAPQVQAVEAERGVYPKRQPSPSLGVLAAAHQQDPRFSSGMVAQGQQNPHGSQDTLFRSASDSVIAPPQAHQRQGQDQIIDRPKGGSSAVAAPNAALAPVGSRIKRYSQRGSEPGGEVGESYTSQMAHSAAAQIIASPRMSAADDDDDLGPPPANADLLFLSESLDGGSQTDSNKSSGMQLEGVEQRLQIAEHHFQLDAGNTTTFDAGNFEFFGGALDTGGDLLEALGDVDGPDGLLEGEVELGGELERGEEADCWDELADYEGGEFVGDAGVKGLQEDGDGGLVSRLEGLALGNSVGE